MRAGAGACFKYWHIDQETPMPLDHHRHMADTISRLFWDNFIKSEPALTMRDVIAVELDKARDAERARCLKIAEDAAAETAEGDGEIYIARKIAKAIQNF
jgi:hypothetical protein